MKQQFDRVNQLGEELNNIDVELATKGLGPKASEKLLRGDIKSGDISWQQLKSGFDNDEWGDADGERMANEVLKLIQNRWDFKQAEQRLNTQMGGFVQNMNPEQARVLQERGIDPNNLVSQMGLNPGQTTQGSYNAAGSAGVYNPYGKTFTSSYTAPQGGQSFADVMGQYIQTPQDLTREQTMTDQQRQQLRALQQLATASGGKFESKV